MRYILVLTVRPDLDRPPFTTILPILPPSFLLLICSLLYHGDVSECGWENLGVTRHKSILDCWAGVKLYTNKSRVVGKHGLPSFRWRISRSLLVDWLRGWLGKRKRSNRLRPSSFVSCRWPAGKGWNWRQFIHVLKQFMSSLTFVRPAWMVLRKVVFVDRF